MSSVDNHIANLNHRHTDLEDQIRAEELRPRPDSDAIRRLKFEKLKIKEDLERLSVSEKAA